MIDAEEFDEETALAAALALQQVLAQRTHRRKYLGQVYVVPGKLGEALKLPSIIARLQSKVVRRRAQGREDFCTLWDTLSVPTREAVLQAINWYDPKSLNWDDKRSNRRPLPPKLPDSPHE
jgi:hypothetical protein